MDKLAIATLALLLASTPGCSTLLQAKVYQLNQGGGVMTAEFRVGSSGHGAAYFTHQDGEPFTGTYTSIGYSEYYSGVGLTLFNVGGTPVVGTTPSLATKSSSTQYGIATMMGNRGTLMECKYVTFIRNPLLLSANILGECKDSKSRDYRLHAEQ